MNVTIAKTAGFCFGVGRAVDTVYKEIEKAYQSNASIYTYGPVIHNDVVVNDMKQKGVTVIESMDHIQNIASKMSSAEKAPVIIIRAHGISKTEHEEIQKAGFQIVDATCPFVKKIHRIVEAQSKNGDYILIIGNKEHPEVRGIRGWCASNQVSILQNREEIDDLPLPKDHRITVVSQTTFNYNKFQEFVEIICEKGYNINVLNTICNATEERQKEARVLAEAVDAMIVIGDKQSSNTQKLFEISKKKCENTYYIQTSSDMDFDSIKDVSNVGITAGASTPNNIIEEVSKNVRKL